MFPYNLYNWKNLIIELNDVVTMRGIPVKVDLRNKTALHKLKKPGESDNDVITRLIQGVQDVFFQFILIDNELPMTHTAVFQLGTEPNSLYYWDGKDTKTITIEEVQELTKKTFKPPDT